MRGTSLLLIAALAVACSRPATQLVPVVSSDFVEPDPLAAVEVAVETPEGVERMRRRFELARGGAPGFTLPLSFGVVPERGDARRRVRVVARGLGSDLQVRVTRSALTGFVPGAALALPLFLPRACANVMCPRGTTCVPGPPVACVSDAVDPGTLPPVPPGVDGGELRLDATLPLDGPAQPPLDAPAPTDAPATDAPAADAIADDAIADAPGDGAIDPGAIPPPRPTAPLSGAVLSASHVSLRWRPALPGSDAVEVEVCADRACTMILQALRPTGPATFVTVVLPPRRVAFWRIRGVRAGVRGTTASPTWQLWTGVERPATARTIVVGYALDANGDGFADAAVGAPSASPMGRSGAGEVRVFSGSASGLRADGSLVSLAGAAMGDAFGASVATAGDVNGDGFGDLIVGAPRADTARGVDAGAVSIYLGGPGGMSRTPVNVESGDAAGDHFGASVAGAGDVNLDGYADAIAGAPDASPSLRMRAGFARVFSGTSAGFAAVPYATYIGLAAGDQLGTSVGGARDVDRDGVEDVILGAPGTDGMVVDGGAAFVYRGNTGVPSGVPWAVLTGTVASGRFGYAVAGVGDFDGDEFADLAVGAPSAGGGAAYVYAGGASGVAATPLRSLTPGTTTGAGYSVAAAGDTDGDGFSDVVVGEPLAPRFMDLEAGAYSIEFGATRSGLVRNQSMGGPSAGAHLGWAVGSPGDLNADGFSDVLIGANGALARTGERTGTVVLFSAGPSSTVSVLDGLAASEEFGAAVAR